MKGIWKKRAAAALLTMAVLMSDVEGILVTEAAVQTQDQDNEIQEQNNEIQEQDNEIQDQVQENGTQEEEVQVVQTQDQDNAEQEVVLQEQQDEIVQTADQQEEEVTGSLMDPNYSFGNIYFYAPYSREQLKNFPIQFYWDGAAKDSSEEKDEPLLFVIYRSDKKDGVYTEFATSKGESFSDVSKLSGCYYYKITAYFDLLRTVEKTFSIQYTRTQPVIYYQGTSEFGKPRLYYGSERNYDKDYQTDIKKKGLRITGYDIYRSTSKNKGYQRIESTSDEEFTDKSAKAGKTYYYKVRSYGYNEAKKEYTYGVTSEPLEVRVRASGTVIFTGRADSGSQITLNWKKNTAFNNYEIYYKKDTAGGIWKKLGTYTGTTCKVKNLVKNSTYQFYLRPYKKSSGKIRYYGEKVDLTVKTSFGTFTNVQVKNVKRTMKKGVFTQKETIVWDKMVDAKSYTLYKKRKDGSFQKVGTTKKNSMTVDMICSATQNDTGLVRLEATDAKKNTVKYEFVSCKMAVRDQNGNYSEEKVWLEPNMKITGLKAKRTGATTVTVSWDKVVGASRYVVYAHSMSTSTGHNIEYYSVKDGKNSCTIKNLEQGMEYTFDLYPYSDVIGTPFEQCKASTTCRIPVKRASVKGKNSKKGCVALTITPGNSRAVSFDIYRSNSKSKGYKKIKNIKAAGSGTTTYTEKGLKKGKTYYYKVKTNIITSTGNRAAAPASSAVAVKVTK